MKQVSLPVRLLHISTKNTAELLRPKLSVLIHRWQTSHWRLHTGSWHQSRLQHGNSASLLKGNGSYAQDVQVTKTQFDTENLCRSIDSAEPETDGKLKESVEKQLRSFDLGFLRDACSCSRCVDPSTRQKRFQTADIPSTIGASSIHHPKAGTVRIVWQNDIPGWGEDHTSEFTSDFFQAYSSNDSEIEARYDVRPQFLWGKKVMEEKTVWFDYEAHLDADESLLQLLEHLSAYGLVFLRGVPDSEQAVEDIGARIGNLRNTFYGRTWDVKSVPHAKNVAYTHQALGLHMDLLYMADPPGLQLLHCLRSSCDGGGSIFSDSFRAALSLKRTDLHALSSFPVTYHYRNAGQHYHHRRVTVEWAKGDYRGERYISNVSWSPPFQAPFEATRLTSKDFRVAFSAYLRAAKAFSAAAEAPESLFETRLEPGQCVIFDNRRVLHARRAFDISDGERWLKGAYIDRDCFLSRLRVLRESTRCLSQTNESKEARETRG